MNFFNAVKERVSMPEVCGMLGVIPNRAGFILCPHRSERTPSCKIYADSFYCYSCGRGGDVIQLVADSKGVSQLEAAREIDNYFRLGLMDMKNKATPRKSRKPMDLSIEQCNEIYKHAALDMLAECCRAAWTIEGDSEDYKVIEQIHQTLLESDSTTMQAFKNYYGEDVIRIVNKYRV